MRNDAHDLVNDADLAEDFYGMSLSRWLTDHVEKFGVVYSRLWDNANNVAEHASLSDWGGVAVMQGYDVAGVEWLADLPCPTQGVEDEPNHGGHTCTWLSKLAESQNLQDALLGLADRSRDGGSEHVTDGDGWLFMDDTLWFDPTNDAVRGIVEGFEFSDVIESDRFSELESEYVSEIGFPNWWDIFRSDFDDTVSEDRASTVYLDQVTNDCTQCYVSSTVAEIIGDQAKQCECKTWTANSRTVCEFCED